MGGGPGRMGDTRIGAGGPRHCSERMGGRRIALGLAGLK